MSKSSQVTALDAGIVTKSNYRGNVQAIPVTLTGSQTAGTYTVSGVLPQEARVLLADITTASGTAKVGFAGTVSAVSADANTTFYGSADVGGKTLIVTTSATSSSGVNGLILIATNE